MIMFGVSLGFVLKVFGSGILLGGTLGFLLGKVGK